VTMSALRPVIRVLTIAAGITTIVFVPYSAIALTTYAGASGIARVTDVVAGLTLLAGGLAMSIVRPRNAIGIVALLAGAIWFAPDWVGWDGGPPLARSVAMVVAPFGPPLLIHVALGASNARLGSVGARAVLFALYGAAAVAAFGLALFRDPFLDQYCWSNCTENVFLLRPEPDLSRLLERTLLVAVLAGAVAVVALTARHVLRTSTATRRVVWPVASAGSLLAASLAAYAVALLLDPAESGDDPLFATLFFARAGAATLLAGALGWSAYVAWRARAAVGNVVRELAGVPASGSLRRALTISLGDPTLEVAYPVGLSDRFVDPGGNDVAPPLTRPNRAVTPIVRNGRCIAVVSHSRIDLAEDELAREIGPAARLSVDNERLRAELLARLHDLQASRARIVEAGDAARRLLERDLHDGAQQRLLAVMYDLRVARTAAGSAGEVELAAVLDRAVGEAEEALEELRELAHGIFPAILAEAGLARALWGLVDHAPLPVELTNPDGGRYSGPVETTAYVVADSAIADASHRTATHAVLRVRRTAGELVVEIEDDGAPVDVVSADVADRVGAVGGRVERTGGILRAELPCA